VRAIRAAVALRPGAQVALMLDTKGPEIRTGLLKDHKPISLVEGQALTISTDYTLEGDATKIACSYKALPKSVAVGATLLIADGSVVCTVTEVHEVRTAGSKRGRGSGRLCRHAACRLPPPSVDAVVAARCVVVVCRRRSSCAS